MPTFNDLPGELQNAILDAFAASATLPDLLKARAANKLLAARFRYALLAQSPPSRFISYIEDNFLREEAYDSSDGPAPFIFWQDNLATVLEEHLNDPSGAALEMLEWLHKVADLVMADFETDRSIVLKELAQAMAITNQQSGTEDEVVSCLVGRTVLNAYPGRTPAKLAYFATKQPSKEDLLAAASAIGNTSMIADLLACNASPFAKADAFSTPVNSAASTGKSAALMLLLEEEDRRIQAGAYDTLKLCTRLTTAIHVATDHGHADAAVLLIRFFRKHCALCLPDVRQRESFLERAAVHGNVQLVKSLVETADLIPDFSQANEMDDTFNAALTSYGTQKRRGRSVMISDCTTGQVETVRFFLDNGALSRSGTSGYGTMGSVMSGAAKSNNLRLIDLLLSRGATKEHLQSALASALTPPLTRNTRPIYSMVQHLLIRGAVINAKVLDQAECMASNVMVAVYGPKQRNINVPDGVQTTILLAHELLQQPEQSDANLKVSMKIILRRMVTGKITVPTRPMPFLGMAKEVVEWLDAAK